MNGPRLNNKTVDNYVLKATKGYKKSFAGLG